MSLCAMTLEMGSASAERTG